MHLLEPAPLTQTATAHLQTTWTVYFDGQGTQILPCGKKIPPGGGGGGRYRLAHGLLPFTLAGTHSRICLQKTDSNYSRRKKTPNTESNPHSVPVGCADCALHAVTRKVGPSVPCITAEFCSPIGNRKRFIRVELFNCIENSSNLTTWKVTKGEGGGGGGQYT